MNAVSFRISGGNGLKRWPISLLLLHVHIEDCQPSRCPPSRPNVLLAAAELAGRHVALHDVDAVLLIEGNPGDLVEADHVVLANQSSLPRRVIDEHLRDGRLAAGDQMRIRRDLLEKMALAGAAWTQFHQVVVPLHERNHAKQRHSLRSLSPSADGSRPIERMSRSIHC